MLASTDGGNKWMSRAVPTSDNLHAIICAGPKNCLAVGESGVILVSTDAGTNWHNRSSM
jgi:photosystem II stability/assembly factor-like uncharacterized protein